MAQWDGGAQALEQGRRAKKTLAEARAALASGSPQRLAEAKAEGWSPSIGDSKEWFGIAMKEPSGASARWLLENFPLDAAESPLFSNPAASASAHWTANAMLAVERFALGLGGASSWAKACSESRESDAYFEKSLRGGAWHPDSWEATPWEPLKALLVPPLSSGRDKTAALCAERAAAWALGLPPRERLKFDWEAAVATLARAMMDAGRPLSSIEPLLALLPVAALAMDAQFVEVNKPGKPGRFGLARGRGLAEWAESARPGRLAGRADARPLGASALLGGSMANFEWALAHGWIGPLRVAMAQKCESPDYVAWDEARIAKELGRHVDMGERWTKCREIIESSALPASERERLLGRCLARDPAAWEPGSPKVFEVMRERKASPLAVLMAVGAQHGKPEEALLEAKAAALSAAGWRMKEALGADDPFSEDANLGARKYPWAARQAERDELSDASAAGAPAKRSMSL